VSCESYRSIPVDSLGVIESRSLNVRLGYKKGPNEKAAFVHMLNGTLCATERALCCIVENYQTPEVSLAVWVFFLITNDGVRE
jgi:seryl-tRNA synthetase